MRTGLPTPSVLLERLSQDRPSRKVPIGIFDLKPVTLLVVPQVADIYPFTVGSLDLHQDGEFCGHRVSKPSGSGTRSSAKGGRTGSPASTLLLRKPYTRSARVSSRVRMNPS